MTHKFWHDNENFIAGFLRPVDLRDEIDKLNAEDSVIRYGEAFNVIVNIIMSVYFLNFFIVFITVARDDAVVSMIHA